MSETSDFENWQRDRVAAPLRQALDEIFTRAIDYFDAVVDEARTIRAYDDFAKEALSRTLDSIGRSSAARISSEDIASKAWAIADAMMAERKKRGLGYVEDDETEGEPHGE